MPSDVPDAALPPRARVLLLSGDPLVRSALVALLAEAGLTVSTERALPVDAVVWDVPSAPAPVLGPGDAPVLALVPDEAAARTALGEGAAGALLRTADARTLGVAIAALARGLTVVERGVLERRPVAARMPTRTGDFTPREREVLALLAQGLSNRAIADALGISAHTAKFHVNALFQKLGVERRTEAVVQAARLGLVTL